MRRLAAAALLALALGAGTASADTFAVVPDRPDNFVVVPEGPVAVPSAEVPNEPGSILLPPGAWDAPFLAAPEVSYEELEALWARAGAAYGIPWQVLAAINKIESNFGRNMGPSSAGAVGWMQFMPDTWLRWGTDGDGDGVVDPWDPEDAVFAAARYLAASGGAHDISGAVFSYNHAQWYVNEVLGLASLFGGDVDVVFTLDKLAVRLEEAQTAVAETSEALEEAESAAADLESRLAALDERAGLPGQLLSDRLDVEKEAFEVGQASTAASAEVERLQAELTTAEAVLEQARTGAHAASFHPAAAGILGGPSRADGYVFPVGGGAQFVSVGHTHHDYPAADIAAQEGSPVYALADAIVLDAVDDGTLRDRDPPPDGGRAPVGLLPPLATRPGGGAGSGALRRPVGRSRRLDGPLHRPAPPSGPEARDELSAGHDVVRGVRRDRVHLAGLAGRRVSEHARLLGRSVRGKRRRRSRVHD